MLFPPSSLGLFPMDGFLHMLLVLVQHGTVNNNKPNYHCAIDVLAGLDGAPHTADTNLPKKKPTKREEEAKPKKNRPPGRPFLCDGLWSGRLIGDWRAAWWAPAPLPSPRNIRLRNAFEALPFKYQVYNNCAWQLADGMCGRCAETLM